METKLARIAEMAKRKPKIRFTSLYHMLNAELLRQAHASLEPDKATGVDGVTKAEYEERLEENLDDLVARLKRKGYRPQPARRTYIPKDEKSTRPLGIPAYEDKLVQWALNRLLQQIYEQDFMPFSYGFRPGRDCHAALKALNRVIEQGKVNVVVDADISGFFNHVDHEWLMKFLDVRICDPNIQRLIRRMLKAGVQEEGNLEPTEEGTPQGSVVSPLLANVYLHYVLDAWFEYRIKPNCKGEAYIVRYADDFVCCFQYEHEAKAFYRALVKRLATFNLRIAEEKTKIIRFGRYAEEWHKRNGGGKPGAFTFLGFTHYGGKSQKGKFRVKRETAVKKYRLKVKAINKWMKHNRHKKLEETVKTIQRKVQGHYNYYGITDNMPMLQKFRRDVERIMLKWWNRRSQKKSFTVEEFAQFLTRYPLPQPKIRINIYR
jgi:group II intron reverse transcriptase/maturase